MGVVIAISRFILPSVTVIILTKCILSLLLGHPKEKIYAFVTNLATGEKLPLNMWETSVGRSPTSDISVPVMTVSRSHAVISRRIKGWYIYDLDSTSGTFVNGKKIEGKAILNSGDVFSLHDVEFRFEIFDDPVQKVGKHRKNAAAQAPAPAPVPQQTAPRVTPRLINPRTGEAYILVGNCVSVGTAPRCDIRLYGMGISRSHAMLVLYEDGWAVNDSNSTNGTYLNMGRVTSPQLLFDGDILTFGSEKLIFKTRQR